MIDAPTITVAEYEAAHDQRVLAHAARVEADAELMDEETREAYRAGTRQQVATKIMRNTSKPKGECLHCHRFTTIACRGICITCWRKGDEVIRLYQRGKRGRKPDEKKQAEQFDRKCEEIKAIFKRAEATLVEIADDEVLIFDDSVMGALCDLASTLHDEHYAPTLCEETFLPTRSREERGFGSLQASE